MKKIATIIKLIVTSIFCFSIITYFSHTNNMQVDGCETYGIPFNFYEICADPPIDFEGGFRVNYIIYDFLIIFGVVFFVGNKSLYTNKK